MWQVYEEFKNAMCAVAQQERNTCTGFIRGERDGLLNMGEGTDTGKEAWTSIEMGREESEFGHFELRSSHLVIYILSKQRGICSWEGERDSEVVAVVLEILLIN